MARRVFAVWGLRIGFGGLILVLWQLSAWRQWVDPTFSGEPSSIARSVYDLLQSGSFWEKDLPITLREMLLGFLLGSAVGIATGIALTRFQLWKEALQPYLSAMNSLPRIALAPLFILWFGLGSQSKVALSFSLVFFIVTTNTLVGLSSGDRDMLLLARTLGATPREVLRKFMLPSAIPAIAAGLQLGLVYGFLGTIGGEMIGGTEGLGVRLSYAANTLDTASFFAILFILMLVSVALNWCLRVVERHLLKWHYVELRGVGAQAFGKSRAKEGTSASGTGAYHTVQ